MVVESFLLQVMFDDYINTIGHNFFGFKFMLGLTGTGLVLLF
jgi:hypothetical protein